MGCWWEEDDEGRGETRTEPVAGSVDSCTNSTDLGVIFGSEVVKPLSPIPSAPVKDEPKG